MGFHSDASILIEDMMTWTTEELLDVWHTSDDLAERYAASHIVRCRAADMIELSQSLAEYGRAHPEQMAQVED